MIERFIKTFFNWVEKGINAWLWGRILKPILKLFPPYRDDM